MFAEVKALTRGFSRRAHDVAGDADVAGPFSMGYVDFYTFLIPLYGRSLGLDASEIGILVGARSILALFLSIHVGVLMDRFGTRRVTLFFVWTGMALAPLFTLVPGFWALFLLQLVNGAAVPSTRCGRGLASDRATAHLDPDPAADGWDR